MKKRILKVAGIIFLAGLLFLLWKITIHAQTHPGFVSWTAVTQNVNGGMLAGPVTYNVYRGIKADGTDLAVINPAPLIGVTYTDNTILLTGHYFYAVTALNGGNESDKSPLVPFSKGDVVPVVPVGVLVH